ncbi:mRNA cap guanine-N7 methyltransferase [Puccinia graminis f. sp. tritici]|uniref:mRNA cap guanine-N(7) methyltransferase n=1 Tax=Puccinia graminis f. sp. tritici TaxID=56615 RepID=A0A5B0LKM5_PUCGR|nr:mRNA cap guanine-N7 methyltransferase [Puccinia graminis f. sp. tritici]
MDRIAYHPIRVSPHASLFLPLSEQELKIYQTECVNTLRVPSGSDPNLSRSQPPDSHINTNDKESAIQPSPQLEQDIGSPVGYTTPSPLSIPISSFPAAQYPHESYPPQTSSTNKRSLQSPTEYNQSGAASSSMPHFPKRTRHNHSPHHSLDNDSHNSISETVAQHYNMRPNLTKGARTESPIFGLRKFNNWVKSVTIGKFASVESSFMAPLLSYNNHPQQQQQQYPHQHHPHPKSNGTKILELGCGKGGDLAKWQNAGVRELFGFDIARVSIEQAQSRYQENCSQRFYAKFVALDCFSLPISSVLSPEELREPFHAVSLQFCMHYAFESEVKARTMMENVTKYLVTGGVMIGTIPDPDLLIQGWERCSRESNVDKPSFGNSVYQIRFPYPLSPQRSELNQVYGNRYSFYLEDAVEDIPEYLVLWEPFVRLAQEYGLKLVYKKGFHELFQIERANPSYKNLLYKMRVTNSEGNLVIPNDQWEATGIYSAFAFVKI